MKKIVLPLAVLLLLMGCESSHDSASDDIPWVDFEWETQHIQGEVYEKASINIPVVVGEVADSFTMQLDLGANLTMLYGQTFDPYFGAYPGLVNRIDTINGYPYLTKTKLALDEEYIVDDFSFFYEADFGSVLDEREVGDGTVKHIGTIGADLFKEKVLIIDYPAKRIAVLDSIPKGFQEVDENIDITLDRWGRAHLPILVNGKKEKVLFDTGSSMFPLITTTSNWKLYTDTLRLDSILTTTWGEHYYTYAAAASDVSIGSRNLEDVRVFDGQYLSNFIKGENIWGIMGNVHFDKDIVVVDFKNLTFGWIRNSSGER